MRLQAAARASAFADCPLKETGELATARTRRDELSLVTPPEEAEAQSSLGPVSVIGTVGSAIGARDARREGCAASGTATGAATLMWGAAVAVVKARRPPRLAALPAPAHARDSLASAERAQPPRSIRDGRCRDPVPEQSLTRARSREAAARSDRPRSPAKMMRDARGRRSCSSQPGPIRCGAESRRQPMAGWCVPPRAAGFAAFRSGACTGCFALTVSCGRPAPVAPFRREHDRGEAWRAT